MCYKTEKNGEKHFRIKQFEKKRLRKKIKPTLLKKATAGLELGSLARPRRIAPWTTRLSRLVENRIIKTCIYSVILF